MKKLKTEINLLLEKEGLSKRVRIKDEAKISELKSTTDIPNGIDMYGMDYFEFAKAEFSDSELNMYIKLRQLKALDIIKKCCVFFTVIVSIGVLIALIFGINLASALSDIAGT